jgi:hypothetical protein
MLRIKSLVTGNLPPLEGPQTIEYGERVMMPAPDRGEVVYDLRGASTVAISFVSRAVTRLG